VGTQIWYLKYVQFLLGHPVHQIIIMISQPKENHRPVSIS